jgi:hypothetical protein
VAADLREGQRDEAHDVDGAQGGRERGDRDHRVIGRPRCVCRLVRRDGHLLALDTYSGVLKGHKMTVMCLAVAGNLIASGSADRTLCI